jgi:hypothetical protein
MLAVERVWVLVTASAAALMTAVIAMVPADEPPPRPAPPPEPMRMIPLTGDSISDLVEDAQTTGGTCLPFVTWIVSKPTWELQLVDGSSGCLGENIRASFEVQHDGLVTWMEPWMPNRRLRLTAEELDTIRHLDQLSCRSETQERMWERGWMRVALAGNIHGVGGATIPQDAPAAKAIDAVMTAAQTRYLHERRAALGPIDISLVATYNVWETDHPRRYRVHITDDRITIVRGRRTIATLPVDAADLVKLVDWALGTTMNPSEYSQARGTLCIGSDCRAIAIEQWERPLFAIARAIDDRLYCDAKPDSMICP